MTGQTTAIALVGATAAAVTSGPIADVFNEMALVLAIMGAFGGISQALALSVPWRDGLRGAVLGALLATGLGALLPLILEPWLGMEIQSNVQMMASSAYIAGFAQDYLISRLNRGPRP